MRYSGQCDTTFNGNDQPEHIVCKSVKGRLHSEIFFTYWPSENLKKKTIFATDDQQSITLFDEFGNCIELRYFTHSDFTLAKKSWKYYYHDGKAYLTITYNEEGEVTNIIRTYDNEPKINDHIEIFDTNLRIMQLEGARPLSAVNPTEQIMFKYFYASDTGNIETIEFYGENGLLIRRCVFAFDNAGELFVSEQKPNGKEVVRTKHPSHFFIQEYRRATQLNAEMQATISLEIDDIDERNKQLNNVTDTTFNDKHLPIKIVAYKPNGKVLSTESIDYYPSDTVAEQNITTNYSRQKYKKNDKGDITYVRIEDIISEKENIIVYEKYFENEYDSLNRQLISHEYNGAKELKAVYLSERDESGKVIKQERLDSAYALQDVTFYKLAENGSEIVETYDNKGYMISASKEIQLNLDSEPARARLLYGYNDHNQLSEISLCYEKYFFGFVNYYSIYFTKNSESELFSLSVFVDNILESYIHKNDELLIHPLAQEFRYVTEQNLKNQKKTE